MPLIHRNREKGISKPLALTIFGAFAIWLVLLINFSQGQKINERFASQIDASMEMRLEAAYAHLWFEKMMSGEKIASLKDVFKHIDNAIWYAEAILSGGTNAKGSYIPLEAQFHRDKIAEAIVQLEEFKKLTNLQFKATQSSPTDPNVHLQYEQTFESIVLIGEELEVSLNLYQKEEIEDFENKHFLIAVIVLIVTFGVLLRIKTSETFEEELDSEVQQEHEQLIVKAHTDPLTGVGNRRAFDEKLNLEFQHAMRSNTPVSLMSIKIDFYDDYVAQFGQQLADECLANIATTLKDICSGSKELVARLNSEFAVIIPNTTHARQIADAIILAVRNDALPNLASKTTDIVTISIGLENMHPEEGLLLPEEFTSKSHAALAQAIEAGGDQVVEFKEVEESEIEATI